MRDDISDDKLTMDVEKGVKIYKTLQNLYNKRKLAVYNKRKLAVYNKKKLAVWSINQRLLL